MNAELQKCKVEGRLNRGPATTAEKLMILLKGPMFTVLLAYFDPKYLNYLQDGKKKVERKTLMRLTN